MYKLICIHCTINKRTYIDRILMKYTHNYKIIAMIQKSCRHYISNNPILVDRSFLYKVMLQMLMFPLTFWLTQLILQSNCTGASLLNGSCCEECLGLGPDRYNQLYAVFSWTYVIAAPGCVNTRINVKLNLIYCSSFLASPLSLYLVFCALEMPLLCCQLEFY